MRHHSNSKGFRQRGRSCSQPLRRSRCVVVAAAVALRVAVRVVLMAVGWKNSLCWAVRLSRPRQPTVSAFAAATVTFAFVAAAATFAVVAAEK